MLSLVPRQCVLVNEAFVEFVIKTENLCIVRGTLKACLVYLHTLARTVKSPIETYLILLSRAWACKTKMAKAKKV